MLPRCMTAGEGTAYPASWAASRAWRSGTRHSPSATRCGPPRHIEMRADDPFHADERALQERMGVREQARQRGAMLIRPFMPEQHQRFFESLPLAFVATLDHAGHPRDQVVVDPL